MSNIKKVVVAGGGVLGSQIAFQTAYSGFDVTIWLRSEGSIGRCQPKIDKLKTSYLSAIEGMTRDRMSSVRETTSPAIFALVEALSISSTAPLVMRRVCPSAPRTSTLMSQRRVPGPVLTGAFPFRDARARDTFQELVHSGHYSAGPSGSLEGFGSPRLADGYVWLGVMA